MTLPAYSKLLFLFAFLVHVGPTKSNAQKRNQIDDYPIVKAALNKKVWSSSKNYYIITKATDSTVHLFWGNDTLKRMFYEDLDLWPAAERLFIKWSNKDYLILEYWTGSGAWVNLVLPINKNEKTQEFDNGLCFDKKANLFVTEEFTDTVLSIHNLKTQATQFVVEKIRPCDAAINEACLDTISISNKVLYYKWTTPHKYSDKKSSIEKHVRVTI